MEDGHLAVIAHGLINSAAAVTGSISTIRELLAPADVDERVALLLDAAERQARFLGDSLRDLLHGMPQDIRIALDELAQQEAVAKTAQPG